MSACGPDARARLPTAAENLALTSRRLRNELDRVLATCGPDALADIKDRGVSPMLVRLCGIVGLLLHDIDQVLEARAESSDETLAMVREVIDTLRARVDEMPEALRRSGDADG